MEEEISKVGLICISPTAENGDQFLKHFLALLASSFGDSVHFFKKLNNLFPWLFAFMSSVYILAIILSDE